MMTKTFIFSLQGHLIFGSVLLLAMNFLIISLQVNLDAQAF
jgi:hypothetical protein